MMQGSHKATRGSILLFFVACMFLLLCCCVIAIDVVKAQMIQAENRGIIEMVCAQKASPSATAYIKNLDNPGEYIAKEIVRGMRDNDLPGPVTINYYELSAAAVEGGWAKYEDEKEAWKYYSYRNRIYVYDVQYECKFYFSFIPTVIAESFPMTLRSSYIKGANPYAEVRIWRPEEAGGCEYDTRDDELDYRYVAREYTFDGEGSTAFSVRTLNSKQLPQEVLYEAQRIFESVDPEHPGLTLE